MAKPEDKICDTRKNKKATLYGNPNSKEHSESKKTSVKA